VVVGVKLLDVSSGRLRLGFTVEDTGIGLIQKQMLGLFKPFTQADGSTTRKYGGTGLGLSICKQLVKLMGGNISVTSELGQGCCFSFSAQFRYGAQIQQKARKVPPELDQLRVLVVDDNSSSREILHCQLESFGFDVTQASSGKAALEALWAARFINPYQLVILDWKMPGMDGIEVAQHIGEIDELPAMPLLMMHTEYGWEEVVHKAKRAGFGGFLSKPVNRSLLFDAILDLLFKGGICTFGSPNTLVDDRRGAENEREQLLGVRVLLVEDNEINQEVAQEIMRNAGLVVFVANNGHQALEILAAEAFDIVLMDLQMPEMDGYQATHQIRKNPNFKQLPIIAMTANAMTPDRERCLSAGMNDHIGKPINRDQLLSTIEKWWRADLSPSRSIGKLANSKRNKLGNDIKDFSSLEGFDVADALDRIGQNQTLYRKLLRKFHGKFAGAGGTVRALIEQGECKEAKELGHQIVGVLANLSANRLLGVARTFENELESESKLSVGPLLDNFEGELDQLMDQIEVLNSQYREDTPE